MAEIKKIAAEQKSLKESLPEGPELVVGKQYLLTNFDKIEIRGIDEKSDKLHYFNFTQQCNVYPKLSTFRAKTAL